MDLQKRSESLAKAKKMLIDKTAADRLHKAGKATAYELMDMLFDGGTFVETNAFVRAYANELGTANASEYEGVVCGYGAVDGRLTFAYAQDASRLNGAFSKAAASKIVSLYEMALKNGAPVVCVFDSNGAKLDEGVDVLAGYGAVIKSTSKALGKVPVAAVVCGNTYGACASVAAMSDVVVMTKNASLSVNPKSVLENAGADENAASAESAAKSGLVSAVAEDAASAFATLKDIMSYLPSNRLDTNVYTGTADDANRVTPEIAGIVANEKYDVHELVKAVADGGRVTELGACFAPNIVTAFATVNGIVSGIVANNPAKDEGALCENALNKAAKFISLCNRFGIAVVSLVDTVGFCAPCEANGGRLAQASAELVKAYTTSNVPFVTVNVGTAYGSALTVMGSKAIGADLVIALDSAKLGVLKPEAGVAMMWTEKLIGSKAPIEKRHALEEDWTNLMSTPLMAAYSGQVDDIVSADVLRGKVASALEMLSMKKEFLDL